jgi:pimeloyl-ACP methyl ester carboxylesterase
MVVDPRWLLKALAVCAAIALLCGYAVICWLFWQGQWQLVLHPSHAVAHTPGEFGLQAQDVRFGVDATGQPQLHGWVVPAGASGAGWAVMLPDGDGDASNLWPRARTLHDAGVNVLLFDYRGYGASGGPHPTQSRMQQDSEWALEYLQGRSGFAAGKVLVYGKGAGASLAVRLAQAHGGVTALVLEEPRGDFAEKAAQDSRARLVPFRMLFREDFPLAQPLAELKTPRLIVSYGAAAKLSATPGMALVLPNAADEAGWEKGLREFLGMYAVAIGRG